jgi:hypothetical protein
MTPLERLNARLSAIYPSTRRASARNAEVRSNSDGDRNDTSPKTQNGSAFSHGTGLYVPPSLHSRPSDTPQPICRLLNSHR